MFLKRSRRLSKFTNIHVIIHTNADSNFSEDLFKIVKKYAANEVHVIFFNQGAQLNSAYYYLLLPFGTWSKYHNYNQFHKV